MNNFFCNLIKMENKYFPLNKSNLEELNSEYYSDSDIKSDDDSLILTNIDFGSENYKYIFQYVVNMVSLELVQSEKVLIDKIKYAIINNNYKEYKYEFIFYVMNLLINYIKKNFEEKEYSINNSIYLKKLLLAKKFFKKKLSK